MKYLKIVLIMLVCLVVRVSAEPLDANSQGEKIVYFGSDITVHKDDSFTVKETIEVACRNIKIKQGIDRVLRTRYSDSYRRNFVATYKVLTVKKDDLPEPYQLQTIPTGIRIRTGRSGQILQKKNYVYTITYKVTSRTDSPLADHEVYWNVTGHDWDLPMDRAVAAVIHPKEWDGYKEWDEAYTGPIGATGPDCSWSPRNGWLVFHTDRPLPERNGLTIYLSYTKRQAGEGSSAALRPEDIRPKEGPPSAKDIWCFLLNSKGILVLLSGLIVVLAYFTAVCRKVGKDPKKGTTVPNWDIPDGLSPAALRYIVRKKCDNKAVTAAIVSMVVKKFLTVVEDKDAYKLRKSKEALSALSPEERVLATQLPGSLFKHNRRMHEAVDSFSKSLETTYGNYFSTNRRYFAIGAVASVIIMIAGSLIELLSGEIDATSIIYLVLLVSFESVFAIPVFRANMKSLRRRVNARNGASVGLSLLFIIPFVCPVLLGVFEFVKSNVLFVFIVCELALVNAIFYILLESYSKEGRAILDKIEGFKLFLNVAEKDGLRVPDFSGKTQELYEWFLPYAIALDVENEWSGQFTHVITSAAAYIDPGPEFQASLVGSD